MILCDKLEKVKIYLHILYLSPSLPDLLVQLFIEPGIISFHDCAPVLTLGLKRNYYNTFNVEPLWFYPVKSPPFPINNTLQYLTYRISDYIAWCGNRSTSIVTVPRN